MRYCLILLTLLLSACQSTTPPPPPYTGPIAKVDDSFKSKGRSIADIFFIDQIDGKDVYNASDATSNMTYGQGANLRLQGMTHRLKIKELTLHLKAHTLFAAPITYMFNSGSSFEVAGDITFTPETDKHYIVNGSLSETHAAVWIEDIAGKIISPVIFTEDQEKQPNLLTAQEYYQLTGTQFKEKSQAERFVLIKGGESVDMILAKFGQPTERKYIKGNAFTGRKPIFEYYYDGLGKINFSIIRGEADNVLSVIPALNTDAATDLSALLSADGLTLQSLAKSYYKNSNLTQEQLDQIATTVWSKRLSPNKVTLDAVAWLIKTLAKHGGNRYYMLIQNLSNTTKYQSKITRHAKSSLRQLTQTSENQFKFKAL